ncbi:MAG: hypothetical protein VW266_01025, partial [Flavobacteriales bacterium]
MMKKFQLSLLFLTALLVFACSKDDGEEAPVENEDPLVGTWVLASEPGALAVGESAGNYGWWSNSADDVGARSCLFDDQYIINADGSFQNNMGSQTWLEGWQGADEGCGAPVAPHDGSNTGTWTAEGGTLTISGAGNFMGLAKVHNSGEDGSPANNTITYNYTLSNNDTV